MTHVKTWMNLEDMMLTVISLTNKDRYSGVPLRGDLVWSDLQRQKVKGAGEQNGSLLVHGAEFHFSKMQRFWR